MIHQVNTQANARRCMHGVSACAQDRGAHLAAHLAAQAPGRAYGRAYGRAPAYAPARARTEEKKKRKARQAVGITIVSRKLIKPH